MITRSIIFFSLTTWAIIPFDNLQPTAEKRELAIHFYLTISTGLVVEFYTFVKQHDIYQKGSRQL